MTIWKKQKGRQTYNNMGYKRDKEDKKRKYQKSKYAKGIKKGFKKKSNKGQLKRYMEEDLE
jgi:hypothetical protein